MIKTKTIRKPATIKDIASQAGVSVAAVSKTLNEVPGIGFQTRKKIMEIAKRLNYHVNLNARALVSTNPETIAIVVPQTSEFAFSNPFYAEVIKGIARKVREYGWALLFSFPGKGSYSKIFLQHLAAGIIVLANRLGDPQVKEAQMSGVPMVLIPGLVTRSKIPSVHVDNIDGAFKAGNHLVNIGHRRIAFIYGQLNFRDSVERLIGYRKALRKHNIPHFEELLLQSDFTQEGGYLGMKKLLSLAQPPTAVLAINDLSALGALKAAKEMAWRVPETVSVVGFGDIPFATLSNPALTTVRQPFQELGYEAAGMLLNLISGKRLVKRHLTLPVELVVRDSTGPP